MMSLAARALIPMLLAISAACAPAQPRFQLLKLPSGKQIKILGIGKIVFTDGGSALMLKYQTDLSLEDSGKLEEEVSEIWPVFLHDVEAAKMTSAIISANTAPQGRIISTNRSMNFVFKRLSDGTWQRVNKDD